MASLPLMRVSDSAGYSSGGVPELARRPTRARRALSVASRRPGPCSAALTSRIEQQRGIVQRRRAGSRESLVCRAHWDPLAESSSSETCREDLREGVQPRAEKKEEGSVLGAIALITGTSVGAGMLALPNETAPGGFLPSATLLLVSWAFLTVEAFLIADVNVALMKKRQQEAGISAEQRKSGGSEADQSGAAAPAEFISLQTMAEETLGPLGGLFSTATYVFLSYTLVVAYVAKAAEVLTIGNDVPFEVAAAGFVAVLGGMVYAGNTATTDWVNRIMTAALLGLFAIIVGGGVVSSDWSALEVQDWSHAPTMLPIVFLSLVFHDLIPVLCTYLNGDLGRVRKSILFGSAVPLGMFLIWDAVALSIGGGWNGTDPMETLMSLGGPAQGTVVEAFSLLAVMTSFIGTALSMSEFFQEQLVSIFGQKGAQRPMKELPSDASQASALQPEGFSKEQLRGAAFLLVLVPSLALSTNIPHAFFTASEAAGAYGMTVLYGIFPPLMFWKSRQQQKTGGSAKPVDDSLWDKPAGGIALASMAACSFSVIVSQAVLDTESFRQGIPGAGAPASSLMVLASSTPVADVSRSGKLQAPGLEPVTAAQSLCAPALADLDSCPALQA